MSETKKPHRLPQEGSVQTQGARASTRVQVHEVTAIDGVYNHLLITLRGALCLRGTGRKLPEAGTTPTATNEILGTNSNTPDEENNIHGRGGATLTTFRSSGATYLPVAPLHAANKQLTDTDSRHNHPTTRIRASQLADVIPQQHGFERHSPLPLAH